MSDLLRSSTFNSFGSFRERSGSSFGQIATVDLKGLGSEYTAVLINGRRVPGSPLTGESTVDLNTIPLSAVDSIEILKDSANETPPPPSHFGRLEQLLEKRVLHHFCQ